MTRHRFSADLRQEHAEAARAGIIAISFVAVFAIAAVMTYAITGDGYDHEQLAVTSTIAWELRE